MSYRNREIESKWIIPAASLEEVRKVLDYCCKFPKKVITGKSRDTYWSAPTDESKAQFVRVRVLGPNRSQITVKDAYKEDSNSRLEIDVESSSSANSIHSLLKALLGPPAGAVTKEYVVYWPEDSEHITISAYIVEGYDNKVIVEIEATTQEQVTSMCGDIVPELMDVFLGVEEARGSLYDMFILGRK
jgi:hypothetical protein